MAFLPATKRQIVKPMITIAAAIPIISHMLFPVGDTGSVVGADMPGCSSSVASGTAGDTSDADVTSSGGSGVTSLCEVSTSIGVSGVSEGAGSSSSVGASLTIMWR